MSKLSFKPRFHTRTHDGHYFCTAPVHVAPGLRTKVVTESKAIIKEGGSVLRQSARDARASVMKRDVLQNA